MNKFVTAVAVFGAALSPAALVSAAGNGHDNNGKPHENGVTGPSFYVDGTLYRTVGTPTDFSHTGAPAHSYDTIYAFAEEDQGHNVATAAPGDPGFNGGRWMVLPVTFEDYDAALAMYDFNGSGDFDSDEEIHAAAMNGDTTIATEPAASFECPVIPVPRR